MNGFKVDKRALYGLILTVVVGMVICLLPTPKGLTPAGQRAIAFLIMAAILWLGEIIPIGASSLLIIVIAPALGLVEAKKSFGSLGHDIIYLFLGGFIIAIAMSKFGLDRRIALWIVRKIGYSTKRVLLGLMIAVGFLSMWMSNTVAVLCILPIVLGILKVLDVKPGEPASKMFLFGLAFASLEGGMATIIGTPPNALAVAYLKEMVDVEITFGQWIVIGFPIAWALVFITWYLLANVVYREEGKKENNLADYIKGEYKKLGKMDFPQYMTAITLIIFVVLLLTIPQVASVLGKKFWIRGVAAVMPVGILYFTGLINWTDTKNGVSWHILLLFAAGLSLSGSMRGTGAATWLANVVGNNLPVGIVPIAFVLLGAIMTQMTSNTGTAAIFCPIAISTAMLLKIDVISCAVPLALGTSLGFLTPIGSALNPLIYGQLPDGNTYIGEAKDYWFAGRLPWIIGMIITVVYVIYIVPVLI